MQQQLALTDLGYEDDNGVLLESIDGRDNATQKFSHRGYVYPEHSGVVVHEEPGLYIIIETADAPEAG